MDIRLDSGSILAVVSAVGTLAGLYSFGVAYNRKVDGWVREHIDEGYIGIEVAVGVFVVGTVVTPWLGFIGSLATDAVTKALLCWLALFTGFLAAGIPMILGDIQRHVARRQASMDAIREDLTQ